MRFVEWEEVKIRVTQKIQSYQKQLENCDLNDVERVRGRIEALRYVLKIEEESPINYGSTTFIKHQ